MVKKKKRANKNKDFFADQYSRSWDYLKLSKNYIYAIFIIFLIFLLIGLFVPAPEAISEQILTYIQEIIKNSENLSFFGLMQFIFWNNLKVSFYGMLFGIVFGILPVVTSISNGYLLGFVSMFKIQSDGVLSLWRLFPHGIFELPAIFISLGLGLKLGAYLFRRGKKSFKEDLVESLRVFIFIVVPLLLVASIIEGLLIFFFI